MRPHCAAAVWLRNACVGGVVALLSACAAVAPGVRTTSASADAIDGAFVIEGRLSARRGSDAVTANFTWKHEGSQDELLVSTPLGAQMAELHGDASVPRVEVRTADNRTDEARDWPTLTERVLGFRLPVDGLAQWVRGVAAPGSVGTVERDALGRPEVLRQEAWEIVYSYPDATTRQPSRLRLTYPELEVRIVIDQWR
jgi:outer membrane lipoprotein LolB